MADFKELISTITNAVDTFNKKIPGIQDNVLTEILALLKKLDTVGDTIKVSVANLKVLAGIQKRLEKVILTPEYLNSVKDYVSHYSTIQGLQNDYFTEIESKFKPPVLAKEIRQQAMESVVNQLTETGLAANVTDVIADMLRQAVTSGGSYNNLASSFKEFLVDTETSKGQLSKYAGQISTDAINQFSGQYTQLISNDLGFEWFRFSGSNIETTRPMCIACSTRKWFHISEMPEVLKGNFAEFKALGGTINKKSGLPQGMIPGTDITNFQVYANGFNCQHKWRPCMEEVVPAAEVARVKALPVYQ